MKAAKTTALAVKAAKTTASGGPKRGYLDGQMLIAMPSMRDERFARSLIYVCAHSSEGAMGIIVNQPAANINFPDLLVQLEVIPAADLIQLPQRAGAVKVLKGGPVETGRGFVLHSADFFIENSTLPIDDGICLTATLDILKAIARGDGPAQRGARARLCGLGAGPARERNPGERLAALRGRSRTDLRQRHRRQIRQGAASKIGIDLGMLSSEAGPRLTMNHCHSGARAPLAPDAAGELGDRVHDSCRTRPRRLAASGITADVTVRSPAARS